MAKVKANTDGFKKLMKNLKDERILRVGIIGDKVKPHTDSGLTTAEIGTFHEFGTKKMSRRSFLEMPLKIKLDFKREDMKSLKKSLWKNLIQKNNAEEFYKELGSRALKTIALAFNTEGFGHWKTLTARTAKAKSRDNNNAHQILTATGLLRNSFMFKVIKK
nr:MAG TPA: virion morphogenesis protein [Caudoviricetes sp.]